MDRNRIPGLTQRRPRPLNERTGGSAELFGRANRVLSAGVASSYQLRDPWPIYLERGKGPKVWDVDDNEMWTSTTASARWSRATRTRRSAAR